MKKISTTKVYLSTEELVTIISDFFSKRDILPKNITGFNMRPTFLPSYNNDISYSEKDAFSGIEIDLEEENQTLKFKTIVLKKE